MKQIIGSETVTIEKAIKDCNLENRIIICVSKTGDFWVLKKERPGDIYMWVSLCVANTDLGGVCFINIDKELKDMIDTGNNLYIFDSMEDILENIYKMGIIKKR